MWNERVLYHPRIGFASMPNMRWRAPADKGGYLVQTNAAGFRSDFEFVQERSPGTFRAMLFGDSQTAGLGVSNEQRYSDLVTQLVPGLEVYNYGLSGSGPEQHYLTCLDCANVEHDLVIVAMHVENINRVGKRFQAVSDSEGKQVVYARPYYTMDRGALVLNHVPVPRGLRSLESVPAADLPHTCARPPSFPRLRKIAKSLGVNSVVRKFLKRRLYPQYDSADDPDWKLLRAILQMWIEGCNVPVLLFLIPIWPFVEGVSNPTNYQLRFAELARDAGCYLHDPLPELRKYSKAARPNFHFKDNVHYSPEGHAALATSLAAALQRIMADRLERSV